MKVMLKSNLFADANSELGIYNPVPVCNFHDPAEVLEKSNED